MRKLTALLTTGFIFTGMLALMGCSNTKSQAKTALEAEASYMLKNLTESSIALDQMLEKVNDLKRINTKERMKGAVKIISNTETALKDANKEVEDYLTFVRVKNLLLQKEQLGHYISVADVLNRQLDKKRETAAQYLAALKKWLTYGADHFELLKAGGGNYQRNYDSLYTTVKRYQKSFKLHSHRYHQYVKAYLKKNPVVSDYFKAEIKTLKKNIAWM